MKAVVLGGGGWGTALALVLCDNGHDVTLWTHNADKARKIASDRENPMLPGVKLPENLKITGDLSCLSDLDMDLNPADDINNNKNNKNIIVCAVPSFAVRETAKKIAPLLNKNNNNLINNNIIIVSASKGIERDTNCRMSEILWFETGRKYSITALSGPSHAEEVGLRLPTGCVAACPERGAARFVQDAFMNPYFRVYTSYDMIGVELCAAMKNIIALTCGVCDGMGYQDNTKALLMTRAMAEMARLGEKLGGSRRTFGGLAGMGDLIVTCTSMHSRNRRAGILIGQGLDIQTAMKRAGGVVEGYYAAASVKQLAEQEGVEMPICQCAYQVLYENRDIQSVTAELMGRARKDELLDAAWL